MKPTLRKSYRSSRSTLPVVSLSVSYQHDPMLARGLGLEHLLDLLPRLARPLLRQGVSLAYAGHWAPTDDNFLYPLLRLVQAEQEEDRLGGPDSSAGIGRLYNHSPWPDCLRVTPQVEAEWINSCMIVRITQELAGIPAAERVADEAAGSDSPAVRWNAAVTLSAARRLMMTPLALPVGVGGPPVQVPPVVARIQLGGKVSGYSGFLPGLFEEALVTLEAQRPLYVLGGFGGAAEVLAAAFLARGKQRPEEFTGAWHQHHTPKTAALLETAKTRSLPAGIRLTDQALDDLFRLALAARKHPAQTLSTGLSDRETRELMTTHDAGTAVRLVRKGLKQRFNLRDLSC